MTQLAVFIRDSTQGIGQYPRDEKTSGRSVLLAMATEGRGTSVTKGEESGFASYPNDSTAFTTCCSLALQGDGKHCYIHTRISQWQPTVSHNLTGKVSKVSAHAVAGGAYSDVWQGEFDGRHVAIKVPRIVSAPEVKLSQVRGVGG
jgi:hypothetical protein